MSTLAGLSWFAIVRLGLVQTCLGAVIVLTTSTINRIMVVELALPAMLPGILVGIHHAVQMSRPRFGHSSDVGGRTTGWIVLGMIILALGGLGAALGTVRMAEHTLQGVLICALAFTAIGLGASAAGTSLLVTLAKHVDPHRKAAAATIVWIMMIAGFAVTAGVAGHYLDPFSPLRLIQVTGTVSALAIVVTLIATYRVEPRHAPHSGAAFEDDEAASDHASLNFREALKVVWAESEARRFTVFVFVSMLAYSAQDLILEPFAGLVFAMTPGESTQLAGVQHGGVLLGMLLVACTTLLRKDSSARALRSWTAGGCFASAVALLGIVFGGFNAGSWPLSANVMFLGLANGAFAVAAIASMMTLASEGAEKRDGLRMGLWGAAQAIAFALGGFLGTVAVDISRALVTEPALAYGLVFALEAVLFVAAASIALTLRTVPRAGGHSPNIGEIAMVEVMDVR